MRPARRPAKTGAAVRARLGRLGGRCYSEAMSASSAQPGLFDSAGFAEHGQAASARVRMREMIERLKAADVPPWQDQVGAILDDGAFQRAMRLVPAEEARALWAEFDAQMERLYAIWLAAAPSPG